MHGRCGCNANELCLSLGKENRLNLAYDVKLPDRLQSIRLKFGQLHLFRFQGTYDLCQTSLF